MPKTCGCCLEEERVETHVGEAFSAPKLFSCLGPAREWLKLLPDCVFEMKEGSKVLVIWNLLPCLNSQGLSTGSLAIFRAPRIRKLSRGCERASPGLNALEANDQPDSMGLKVSAHRLCKESRVGAKKRGFIKGLPIWVIAYPNRVRSPNTGGFFLASLETSLLGLKTKTSASQDGKQMFRLQGDSQEVPRRAAEREVAEGTAPRPRAGDFDAIRCMTYFFAGTPRNLADFTKAAILWSGKSGHGCGTSGVAGFFCDTKGKSFTRRPPKERHTAAHGLPKQGFSFWVVCAAGFDWQREGSAATDGGTRRAEWSCVIPVATPGHFLGPPVVPFSPPSWGRVPLLK